MVAVDEELRDLGDRRAGLPGQQRAAAVLVQTHHGGEAVLAQAPGLAGGDHAVGVAGIADHRDPRIVGRDLVDRTALRDEDLAVVLEQISPFHPGAARLGADQQAPVCIFECGVRIAGQDHVLQQRESAVLQLHRHAAQCLLRSFDRDLQELEDHRLVLAQHLARRDPEQQGVADVAGRAGDRHTNGTFGGHDVCSWGCCGASLARARLTRNAQPLAAGAHRTSCARGPRSTRPDEVDAAGRPG